MQPSISLTDEERNDLLDLYRREPDPKARLRAHITLLLAAGHTRALITDVLFTSTRTVGRWQKRFAGGRVGGLRGGGRGRRSPFAAGRAALAVTWVLGKTPRAFGLCRSRWACAAVALLLWREHAVGVSREIHALCDNARAHDCKAVDVYLAAHGGRIRLHYLPERAPECNPVGRVWWHPHDEVTRNHGCETMRELLELVLRRPEERNPFRVEGSVYPRPKAA